MTKDEALRLALEYVELVPDDRYNAEHIDQDALITAIKAALEAKNEKPCPEFWDWLPKAYRHGDVGDEPRFTKYNMEVAFLAGKQSAALEAKYEPVAWMHVQGNHEEPSFRQLDDWEIQNGWKQYPLYTTPPQRKPLTDDEITLIIADCASSHQHTDIHLARAIEAAHGIKGEA